MESLRCPLFAFCAFTFTCKGVKSHTTASQIYYSGCQNRRSPGYLLYHIENRAVSSYFSPLVVLG
ncbi:hypothetical protein PF010_g29764 [Phytophthora fragariae]|uniref:Uncharacterized protein n=1 Tax=Phytophthora fragariae TaxID=53985 RepID=A0A6A3GD30_9STRA|nr:hypothetical protein PF011_g32130 [Phytophthora fragariae]KAE9061578.1 hypothetical protein PF010_g29764 [Phytophthora fragariae]KAE9199190.1 hypothetical protein PF004_g19341 [Phytophthora fragariae]KAE9273458.1 hypothetical protein PF008_g29829 [Phytophthora fragariae]